MIEISPIPGKEYQRLYTKTTKPARVLLFSVVIVID